MIPILIFVLVTFAAGVFWAGVGVSVFKLPAGRGVLVAGAGVKVRVGVWEGSGVSDKTPVTVGGGVKVGVLLGEGVSVKVAVRVGAGLGVAA